MTSKLKNNYYLKEEHLTSAYNNLFKTTDLKEFYLLTIQPISTIWTLEDATKYLNKLLPDFPPLILVLENNDKVTHKLNGRYYDLLPTLHLHIIIPSKHIQQLKNIVFYKSINELKQIKRNLRVNQLHIVARKIFSNDWKKYLLKQNTNTHLPILLNPIMQRNKIDICSKVKVDIKQQKNGDMQQTYLNPFNLLQILYTGRTFSEVKHILQSIKKECQIKLIRLLILPRIESIKLLYIFNFNYCKRLIEFAKPPPINKLTLV